ncbi:hypothetical protein [Nonomuraea aurantiaca]|uniref:hypothetical protein n=1 Tax=Nonomuraea aurantiaca TaxID=2878562 RepID=UPI001CD9B030|nr:hypothetical protein [Nonomuraea aurantiaca]MCA2220649.1 hypothetical protein [Nonomuraea aurantiaca]
MAPIFPALQSKAALQALGEAARSAPALWTGVAVAVTAVANLPGMGDAKANWGALAKALEVEYPGMLGNAVFLSRADWVADDREAFLNACTLFGGDLQKLSGLCYNLEGQVDQVRDAYNRYWMDIAAIAVTVVGYVVACGLMRLTPYTRAYAEVLLNRLVALTNFVIAKNTKIFAVFLAVAGATLATSSQSLGQLFNLKPTGSVEIDFHRARISTRPPSTYVAPKREIPEPYQKPKPPTS